MALGEADLARFLLSLALLYLSAIAAGKLFVRWGQPRVIGEIAGGALLGPSLLGVFAPALSHQLLPKSGPVAVAIEAIYQLGLIWVMFFAGTEMRRFARGRERATTTAITLTGTAIPFGLGLAFCLLAQPEGLVGPAHDQTALALVFAAALSVTSIPILARMLLDLGLSRTSFARIVLSAAVVEDLVMFTVLGVAIGLVQSSAQETGLVKILGIPPGSAAGAAYYLVVTVMALAVGSAIASWASRPGSLPTRAFSDTRLVCLFLLALVTGCLFVSIQPLYGGLVAGLAVAGRGEVSEPVERVRSYGATLFVPIYFALVGSRLDLWSAFDLVGFLLFFLAACGLKMVSVFFGARLAGESSSRARDIAIAMNARGGPGIILASVSLQAGIINDTFYATMVMLAIVSCLLAGWWLNRRADSLRELSPAILRAADAGAQPAAVRVAGGTQ